MHELKLDIIRFYVENDNNLKIAKEQKADPWKVILEHLTIALVVVTITHYVGDWISSTFG